MKGHAPSRNPILWEPHKRRIQQCPSQTGHAKTQIAPPATHHQPNAPPLSHRRRTALLAARARAGTHARAPRERRRGRVLLVGGRALEVGQHALELAHAQLEHLVLARQHEGLGLVEGGVVARGRRHRRRPAQRQVRRGCRRGRELCVESGRGRAAGGAAAVVRAVAGEGEGGPRPRQRDARWWAGAARACERQAALGGRRAVVYSAGAAGGLVGRCLQRRDLRLLLPDQS